MYEDNNSLESESIAAKKIDNLQQRANYYRDVVIPLMGKVRFSADELELITAKKYWPMPTYSDLIYKV
jgi:glutamine synthetase